MTDHNGWPPTVPLFVAVGHVLLLAVIPERVTFELPATPALLLVTGAELLFLGILIASALRSPPRARGVMSILSGVVGLFVLLLASLSLTDQLWFLAIIFSSVVAVIGYGIHRVELVRTGQVTGGER